MKTKRKGRDRYQPGRKKNKARGKAEGKRKKVKR